METASAEPGLRFAAPNDAEPEASRVSVHYPVLRRAASWEWGDGLWADDFTDVFELCTPVAVPAMQLVGHEITIAGSCVGTYTELAEVVTLSATGRLHVEVETFALANIADAVNLLKGGHVRGRAVITP